MITVGILTNIEKDGNFIYTKQVIEAVASRGGRALTNTSQCTLSNCTRTDDDKVISNSDVLICLGGDGTFLKIARKAYNKDIPILGINLGSLGFLTEVEKTDIDNAIDCVIKGKYTLEDRIMLEAVVLREGNEMDRSIALNDLVISRGNLKRILHLKTYINDVFVDSFPGDGLIISSPTGSTAYSLSAGGPIVEPDSDLIVITPICPHILYSRSFITGGGKTVSVVVDENYNDEALVTADGQKGYTLQGGDTVKITKAAHSIKLIRINPRNFFSVLRTKIYDRGESVRKNEI